MAEDTHIKAKLEVETSGAKAALHGLEEGFEHVHEKASEVGHEFASMAKQALATAAGFQLSAGIEGMKEFGHEIFHAAMEAGGQTKAIAGVLAMNDKLGQSFEELREHAGHVREDLDDIATKRGAGMAETVEAFEAIAARSSKSTDELVDFTDKMALAGRATRGGLTGLSEGFAMFEAGAMRARNPVVQLIAQTGILKGNAKEVSAQLQKMKPEDAIKLGEAAIERMADKMKDVKPSFGEALQSVKNIREELMVAMGTPLLNAIKGPLLDFRNYVMAHRHEIEKYAEAAGQKIGEWTKAAAELMRDGFQAIQSHADEIKDALKEGWAYAKAVMEFVVSNKDLLKLGLEAYAGSKVAGGVLGAAGGALGVPGGATGLIKAGIAGGAPSLGIAGGGAAATAATLGALTAALVSVAWASKQWLDVIKEKGEISSARNDLKAQMEQLAKLGDVKGIDRMVASMREMDDASRVSHARLAALTGGISNLFVDDTTMGSQKEFDQFANEMQATAAHAADALNQVRGELGDYNELMLDQGAAMMLGAEDITNAYAHAVDSGNEAAMRYAGNILLHSGLTAQVLEDSGIQLAGGFEKFQELFSDAAGDTADLLKNFMGKGGKPGDFKGGGVHIGAGGHFEIKQDFRDQDPDRIVAIMRRDLVKAAEARHQSRLGAPFSGL